MGQMHGYLGSIQGMMKVAAARMGVAWEHGRTGSWRQKRRSRKVD